MGRPLPSETADTFEVPELRPVTDPLALKAMVMDEYRAKATRSGTSISEGMLASIAEAELRLADAYNEELDRIGTRRRARRSKIAERTQSPGPRAPSGSRTPPRPRLVDAPAHLVSAQWAAATQRIARILETDARDNVHVSYEGQVKNTAAPSLAREYLRLWGHYLLPDRNTTHNPFMGMNDRDRAKKFMRAVMDICDRSTGRLGPWWVK